MVQSEIQLVLTKNERFAGSEKCLVSDDASPVTEYPDIAEKTLHEICIKNIHQKWCIKMVSKNCYTTKNCIWGVVIFWLIPLMNFILLIPEI
jgi:hypothetical protein